MKKRLLMILGAGSSLECGMPSTSDLSKAMLTWSDELADQQRIPNYFRQIWDCLVQHLKGGFADKNTIPDFERALNDLIALMHWVRPPPEGGVLRALVTNGALPNSLTFRSADAYAPYIDLKVFAAALIRRLADHMRAKAVMLDPVAPAMLQWRAWLDALRSQFDVAIYNLNYDNVAACCWPDAFSGFDDEGFFMPASMHRTDWNGLFHLHGSVQFTLVNMAGPRIVRRAGLGGEFADCEDSWVERGSDGRDFPPSTLIAGGFKLDQLLVEPFHSYQAALVRDVSLADAIVLGGYGFTDAHVNRALRNVMCPPQFSPFGARIRSYWEPEDEAEAFQRRADHSDLAGA